MLLIFSALTTPFVFAQVEKDRFLDKEVGNISNYLIGGAKIRFETLGGAHYGNFEGGYNKNISMSGDRNIISVTHT